MILHFILCEGIFISPLCLNSFLVARQYHTTKHSTEIDGCYLHQCFPNQKNIMLAIYFISGLAVALINGKAIINLLYKYTLAQKETCCASRQKNHNPLVWLRYRQGHSIHTNYHD